MQDPGLVCSLLPGSDINCSDLYTDGCAAVFQDFFYVILSWCIFHFDTNGILAYLRLQSF